MIAVNELARGAYIRPMAFRGYGEIGVAPKIDPPVDVAVAAWEWGKYLGHESEATGVDVCVSSWQRVAPNTLPATGQGRRQLSLEPAHQPGGQAPRASPRASGSRPMAR